MKFFETSKILNLYFTFFLIFHWFLSHNYSTCITMSLCFKKKEKNVFGQMIEAPCIIIFCQHKRLKKLSSKVSQLWKKKSFKTTTSTTKSYSCCGSYSLIKEEVTLFLLCKLTYLPCKGWVKKSFIKDTKYLSRLKIQYHKSIVDKLDIFNFF